MAYVITIACIGSKDESCIEVCPVDCIYDIGEMMAIHPDECIDCGACLPECPVEAIVPEADCPSELAGFVDINAALRASAESAQAALAAELVARSPARSASLGPAASTPVI